MSENGNSNSHQGHHDFTATIAASACVDLADSSDAAVDCTRTTTTPHVIHAVSISQPMQSWTVIRDHIDFTTMDSALKNVVTGLPNCPGLPVGDHTLSDGSVDVNFIVQARTYAQDWLAVALTVPAVRNSAIMRQFLCYGANIVPPQFEGVGWVNFNLSDAQQARKQQSPSHHAAPASYAAAVRGASSSKCNINLDEMEMDVMFAFEHEDNDNADSLDDNENYDEDGIGGDDDTAYLHEPTKEVLSREEVMEIQQDYKGVEMVEDVGSLARSLGASHLGRSLNLQKEMMMHQQQQMLQHQELPGGVNIMANSNNAMPGMASSPGGIGNAMAKAFNTEQPQAQPEPHIQGLGNSIHRTSPVSAPKLDSFKMLKVIGKGSFGKFCVAKMHLLK
jgi:hypothetical protein